MLSFQILCVVIKSNNSLHVPSNYNNQPVIYMPVYICFGTLLLNERDDISDFQNTMVPDLMIEQAVFTLMI